MRKKLNLPHRGCPTCGAEFKPRRTSHNYCSRKCQNATNGAAYYRRMKEAAERGLATQISPGLTQKASAYLRGLRDAYAEAGLADKAAKVKRDIASFRQLGIRRGITFDTSR